MSKKFSKLRDSGRARQEKIFDLPHLDFAVMYFGGDSCNSCGILSTEILRCRPFAAVFADEGDAHVFCECEAVALFLVHVRVIASVLFDDESEPFLRIKILSHGQN